MKKKIFTLSVRLRSINTTPNLYQYDWNGNVEDDNLNNNTSMKYDYRNLLTEITRIDNLSDPPAVYTTRYQYDESGNRIRKFMTKFTETTNDTLINEYYVRDISGREIAIYDNRRTTTVIEYWNVWAGSELIGRINPSSENDRYYYLKDHLGTIRAVLDNSSNIVFAQDYDHWGYPLQNRVSGNDTIKNKFTGKERDKETTYDYFGARYYDARVANWTSPDPLIEKHLQWSPYNYVLRNPMLLIDPDGRQITVTGNIEDMDFYKKYLNIDNLNYNGNQLEYSGKDNLKGAEQEIVNKEQVRNVNKFLTGWTGFYRLGNSSKALNKIRDYTNKRLRRLLQRNKGNSGYGWKKIDSEKIYGKLGLFCNYRVQWL